MIVRLAFEACERRLALAAAGRMAVGMNLENVVDWSPAWTFTDAFKASRPWISQAFDTATWSTSWDPADAPPLALDADGNVTALASWTNQAGQGMRQLAATLMFRSLGGGYPGGRYRAEWDGTGVVTFGFDARVVAQGRTPAGRGFADLEVTPSDAGILLRIDETSPTDPARNFNVWMPDWQGRSFVGERWRPGAAFSPFHPLFLQRLAPFSTLRFMGMQETNTSDLHGWADRRDAADIRQGSGPGGTPSEPVVNGMALEYMVQLANDLDANAWFNMPHQADDDFVRRFAGYVRDHLEPGRTVYVEWANEVWNFGWGFEASAWVAEQARREGLDGDLGQWIVAGREAKRDFDIWSAVFAGQESRLVRVAAGQAANPWIVEQITDAMGGAFDAIALAPYITPTDVQRDSYSAATTVETVLADTRANVATSVQWVADHRALADRLAGRLGRPVRLVAYEGGPHLDGRGAAYQGAFHAATNDRRMGDIYREYLVGLDAAGLELFVDFQFTGAAGATTWGDFAKLHRMDEALDSAHRYAAVVAAADGSLWGPGPLPVVTIAPAAVVEGRSGFRPLTFTITLSAPSTRPVGVRWATSAGSATAGSDYRSASGTVVFQPGQRSARIAVRVIGDRRAEGNETFFVTLSLPERATIGGSGGRATGTILDDDRVVRTAAAAAFAALTDPPTRGRRR